MNTAKKKATRVARKSERRANRPERIDPAQAYSIEETSAALDIGVSSVFKLAAEGKVRVVKLGGRTRVSGAEIMRLTSGTAA